MTKAELIDALIGAAKIDLTKAQTAAVLDAINSVLADQLKAGGDVTLPGLGKFAIKQTAERTGRNPATGETITIAAKRAPKFTAAKAFKDAVA
ncbi:MULTISPECIES: HU family DNA-binding protein [Microvirgula]|uniref:HU family DNA-binding protein n=1 Tax=Microvirgula aerodenitrificans TaxID=57480 RepID=A0A2S0PEU7_9NEIS|nr:MULTISPECIES: HU family DNA-binding protein [Microvirgula]AVY95892.1 HU family DNA-binding protein [Microvirgula aerodenitrificans]RAS09751.1 DNA-binding protein HU-beta [Microvirgula sp. AG722]